MYRPGSIMFYTSWSQSPTSKFASSGKPNYMTKTLVIWIFQQLVSSRVERFLWANSRKACNPWGPLYVQPWQICPAASALLPPTGHIHLKFPSTIPKPSEMASTALIETWCQYSLVLFELGLHRWITSHRMRLEFKTHYHTGSSSCPREGPY